MEMKRRGKNLDISSSSGSKLKKEPSADDTTDMTEKSITSLTQKPHQHNLRQKPHQHDLAQKPHQHDLTQEPHQHHLTRTSST